MKTIDNEPWIFQQNTTYKYWIVTLNAGNYGEQKYYDEKLKISKNQLSF